MAALTVGFLFPYSGIFRSLKQEFRQGFDLGFSVQAPTCMVSGMGEFIQTGDRKSVENALNKLVFYDQVDVVLGIVGKEVTTCCLSILQKSPTPVLINNLGAHLPSGNFSEKSLFYNSLHLWKSQWALGAWAQAQYGGKPSINLSLYESGYHLHECFKLGIAHSGADHVVLNVLKNMTGPVDTTPLMQYLNEQQPPHAHVLVSGKESVQFLELFAQSPLREVIPLTIHPFMAEDIPAGYGKAAGDTGIDMPFAATWICALENAANRLFVEKYYREFNEMPGVYSLLGYEDGLALGAAVASIEGRMTREKLADALASVRPVGPRGEVILSTQPLQAAQPVYLCRPEADPQTGAGRYGITQELPAVHWDDPVFEFSRESASGWVNPYLCV